MKREMDQELKRIKIQGARTLVEEQMSDEEKKQNMLQEIEEAERKLVSTHFVG